VTDRVDAGALVELDLQVIHLADEVVGQGGDGQLGAALDEQDTGAVGFVDRVDRGVDDGLESAVDGRRVVQVPGDVAQRVSQRFFVRRRHGGPFFLGPGPSGNRHRAPSLSRLGAGSAGFGRGTAHAQQRPLAAACRGCHRECPVQPTAGSPGPPRGKGAWRLWTRRARRTAKGGPDSCKA